MAIEYDRIIYNVRKPSPKSVLVSIPMYMFRIKTKKFSDGLDFFQRAVLMFKCGAVVDNSEIAAYLGLEEDLVNEIQNVLAASGYLNNSGVITPKGLEMRNNIDSIEVDQNAEEVGYVFQFIDRNDYYSRFVKNIGEAPNLSSRGEIIIGTKGDGGDRAQMISRLDDFIERKNLPYPNERVILDLISKSLKGGGDSERVSITEIGRDLSLSHLPTPPEPIRVGVCSYIYLPEREDGLYESEWQILDPFGDGDNGKLKFYLESFKDEGFNKLLTKNFGDAETIGKKKYSDYVKFRDEQVDKLVEGDFNVGFECLDENLKGYARSIIGGIYELREAGFKNDNAEKGFISGCHTALENIFKADREKRGSIYEKMENKYSTPEKGDKEFFKKKRYRALKKFVESSGVAMGNPKQLYDLTWMDPKEARSLKHYMYAFVLTYEFNDRESLFQLVDGKIETIIEIANLRNKREHGKTANEGKIEMLKRDEVEDIYSFVKDFINKYIEITL